MLTYKLLNWEYITLKSCCIYSVLEVQYIRPFIQYSSPSIWFAVSISNLIYSRGHILPFAIEETPSIVSTPPVLILILVMRNCYKLTYLRDKSGLLYVIDIPRITGLSIHLTVRYTHSTRCLLRGDSLLVGNLKNHPFIHTVIAVASTGLLQSFEVSQTLRYSL